jgi:hypothetical protein
MKGTLIGGEKVTSGLYLIFHSGEFPETTHLTCTFITNVVGLVLIVE